MLELCTQYELCEHMDSPDMLFILFSRLLSMPGYSIAPRLCQVSVPQPIGSHPSIYRLVSAELQATGFNATSTSHLTDTGIISTPRWGALWTHAEWRSVGLCATFAHAAKDWIAYSHNLKRIRHELTTTRTLNANHFLIRTLYKDSYWHSLLPVGLFFNSELPP